MTQAYDDDPAAGLARHGEAPAPARAATYRSLDCGPGDDGAYRAAFPELATMLDGIHRRTRFCRRCRAPRDLHPLCAVCGRVVCAVDDAGCCPSCAEGRRRYARRGYQVGSGLIGSRTPAQATR